MSFKDCKKDIYETLNDKNAFIQLYGGAALGENDDLAIKIVVDGKTYELETKLVRFSEWKD